MKELFQDHAAGIFIVIAIWWGWMVLDRLDEVIKVLREIKRK